MKQTFIHHFSGTYKRPKSFTDLQRYTQKKGETSRDFISRWIEMKNTCEGVSQTQAMHTFMQSFKKGSMMRFMLASHHPEDLGALLDIANKYAAAEDDAREDGGEVRVYMMVNPEKKGN